MTAAACGGYSGILRYNIWDVCLYEVFPITAKPLKSSDFRWTGVDKISRSRWAARKAKKSASEIRTNPSIRCAMRSFSFDPATNGARRGADALGDLLDRVEFRRFRLIGFHFHHRLFPVPPARHDLGGDDLLSRSPLRFQIGEVTGNRLTRVVLRISR